MRFKHLVRQFRAWYIPWSIWYLLHVYILLYLLDLIYAPPKPYSSMTLELVVDITLIIVGYVVVLVTRVVQVRRVVLINATAIIVMLLLVLLIGLTDSATVLSDWITIAEQPVQSDAIISMFWNLEDYTVSLYRAGYASRILMFGEPDLPPDLLAQYFQLHNIPPAAVTFIGGRPRNTYEGTVMMARYLRDHGLRRGLLITTPVRTYRTSKTFAKHGVQVICTPLPMPSFEHYTFVERFSVRQLVFFEFLHEAIGVGYYALRGRL